MSFPSMHMVIPEARVGDAIVEHFDVSDRDSAFTRLRDTLNPGRPGREYIPPGRYARLRIGGKLVMTDTAMERESNCAVVREARGDVLIAGLGLGMIVVPIARKPEVRSVTVIERSADAIALVMPPLGKYLDDTASKLIVVLADAFTWRPAKGAAWDTIYFDIWSNISTGNLREIVRLKRKFRQRIRLGGWMGAWMQRELQARERRL